MFHSKYHGLINQGSTCYLNSVLQVLFMTKEFREAVERYHCESEPLDFYLKDLFNKLKSQTAFTTKLTGVLGISRDFLQSDAAEWFENILNKMSNHEATQIFQGIQITKNKCISCMTETETEDPFWSLPLEMEDIYDNYDVITGFENYFKESKLSGENQLYCENCSTKSDATVKVEINHHPEVLTLLLKRFKFDYDFMKHVKINRTVKIPEFLQIPPYGEMTPTYQLYAYVEHSGELRSGHYVVTIKDEDGDWYVFNDLGVSKKYWQPFSHQQSYEMSYGAYLLFYRKMSADNSSTSTSGCPRSDQPCRIDIETKEGQKGEEDRFVTNSDKPTKDRELVGLDTNTEMGNKQVQSDRRSTTVIENQHNKQRQDLDSKQYATSKLSKNLPTGLHSEDSVVSDTTKGDSQPERQEQDQAAAQAECSGVKEKGEINIEEQNNKMHKQAKDHERISGDIRSVKKRLTKYDLMNPLVGVQNNPSKLHSDRKELKTTSQNHVDVGNRSQRNRSNEQAQSSGREGDGRSLENLVDNKERPGPKDQQRTQIEVVLNKPTEVQKFSKRKNSLSPEIDQHVEIRGESYKICDIINGKNEKYILLKEICQANREDYKIQDRCNNTDCEIHKLWFDHTHFSEEPSPELKRKLTKMHTVGPSESYKGGSERSQETRPENQPGQIITASRCPSNQNQMANSIQSGTANKAFEDQDAGAEHNYLTRKSSRDTTLSLEVGGGAGGDLQQPLDPQSPGSSEGLISCFQGLTVNDSSEPKKSCDQRLSTKSETFTGNHRFIDSDSRRNANSQSNTQLQVKTDETEKGRKDVCSNLFGSFYN